MTINIYYINVIGLKLHDASTHRLSREGSLVSEGAVSCILATSGSVLEIAGLLHRKDGTRKHKELGASDYPLNDGVRKFSQNNAFSPGFSPVTTFRYKL